jgi:hypothetical protein
LSTIATKAGQDLEHYLAQFTAREFIEKINSLHSELGDEPEPNALAKFGRMFSRRDDGDQWVDSQVYPGNKRLEGTNLFVRTSENFAGSEPKPDVVNFARALRAGNVVWYRGIAIPHFSWSSLTRGVLSSEGTDDRIMFTMDDTGVTTRWLPGVNHLNDTLNIAASVDREQPGMLDLVARGVEIPIGASVRVDVDPQMPIAYLNAGEQLLRGPLHGANLVVEQVVVMGATGTRMVAHNSAPTDLPPAAPYKAAQGSNAIQDWEHRVTQWIAQL